MPHLSPARHGWLPLAVVFVAGCAGAPKRELPDIGFAESGPIALAVDRVEIDVETRPPTTPPHVGHRFIQPLSEIAARWGSDRLHAAGNGGRVARYVVVEADAVGEEVERAPGLAGLFGEERERYDLSVEMRLEILDPSGAMLGYAAARGEFSQAVDADAGEARLRRIWHHMAGQLMEDMDVEMEGQIRSALPAFLLPEEPAGDDEGPADS
jgi:hypothetical protein